MTLVFAGHELDPRRQELRREGEVVHVEPQVFDLLTFLIRNRDRIVSKDEILDTIWDGRIVSEAALSSRINAARKAIGDSGNDQIFIRTFHKRGFRFVADATELSDDAPPPDGGDGGRRQAEAPAAAIPALGPTPDQEHGKPSIAVVPFQNLSQDSEHEYFAYGLTEDVVRLLGRNRWLTVMTRHTTAPGRGGEVDARALGAALGVRYLVE
ncbi:MAG TPA: winged helix-turn-helix domain-containing protein, partial [Beijerinckiaceae bacterium]|nr:winged helix-turn-helix domain-containing protein [Beijerinckiaceae bacterium]